ncbi:transposable element Tcb1 transposase [Trichonephila clavipes]|nr:transposable element Tcb1 transposase [Trichonephila clavipes]
MNPGCVLSTKMVAFVFGGIVVNAHWKRAFFHRHTGPSSGLMVWSAIGHMSWSPLVHIDGTLNRACYFSGVLRPGVLPFIRALRKPTFQQNNARLHVAGIARTFLHMENARLLPWPQRSSDLSPIENP